MTPASPRLSRVLCAVLALCPFAARADKVTLRVPPPDDEEERPVATAVTAGVQGSDYALRIEFDRAPWGDECKSRCASTTILLDLDGSTSTGLQLGPRAPETGADLAIVIRGTRVPGEEHSVSVLQAKVRRLTDGATSIDTGDSVADFDVRNDPDRLRSVGNEVYLLIDGTSGTLPSARTMRVIFHPPGAKALVGKTKGLMAGGANKVEIFRKGKPAQKNTADASSLDRAAWTHPGDD